MKKREFVVQDILSKIYQEYYLNGKLPTQRSLAIQYEVSRYTIQEAINSLSEIGVVQVVQGSGTFIRKDAKQNPLIYNSLTRNSYNRISSKIIFLEKQPALEEDRQIFELDNEQYIWIFQRIRIVNYKITQIETSKLPVSLFPDLTSNVVEDSIQKYVQQSGYDISHYITSYTPVLITRKQSELLLCKKGTPAMKIINRCILKSGQVYEYSEVIAIDYTCTYIIPFNKESHQTRQND